MSFADMNRPKYQRYGNKAELSKHFIFGISSSFSYIDHIVTNLVTKKESALQQHWQSIL